MLPLSSVRKLKLYCKEEGVKNSVYRCAKQMEANCKIINCGSKKF